MIKLTTKDHKLNLKYWFNKKNNLAEKKNLSVKNVKIYGESNFFTACNKDDFRDVVSSTVLDAIFKLTKWFAMLW